MTFCLQDEDPVPFAFYVTVPGVEEGSSAPTRISIANSLKQDILDNPKHPATAEDVFVVHCSPQAVFRVRPATRCSSTLSGVHFYSFSGVPRISRIFNTCAFLQATALPSSALRFPRPGTCSPRGLEIRTPDCGILTPKRPHMSSRDTRGGSSASSGRRGNGNLLPVDTTDTFEYGTRRRESPLAML